MYNKQVLLATAEMGYGHLRALYPFSKNPDYKLIVLGQTDSSNLAEKQLWKSILKGYETVSRIKNIPVLGWFFYGIMNKLLSIPSKYSIRDRSDRIFSFWLLERLIEMGLCKGLQNDIIANETLVFTSFYAPVIALSKKGGVQVYCQICDSDLSRVWVVRSPEKDRTHYFAPCNRAAERLFSYGVELDMIHVTGFPFPDDLIGGYVQEKAKRNFQRRMILLENPKIISAENPLKITYVVGGAGAYSNIGITIANALKEEIINGKVILYLVTGVKQRVTSKYQRFKDDYFPNCSNIQIVKSEGLHDYFQLFTDLMSHVHILWTKPSELVFYSALGIPLIMTSPLGPQEVANREWVLETGVGIDQHISKDLNQWIKDKLFNGTFGRVAHFGWDNGIRTAVYNIPEIIYKTSRHSQSLAPIQ